MPYFDLSTTKKLMSDARIGLAYNNYNYGWQKNNGLTDLRMVLNVDRTGASLPVSSLTATVRGVPVADREIIKNMKPYQAMISISVSPGSTVADPTTAAWYWWGEYYLKSVEFTDDVMKMTAVDAAGALEYRHFVRNFDGRATHYIDNVINQLFTDLTLTNNMHIESPNNQAYDSSYYEYYHYPYLWGHVEGSGREVLRQILQATSMVYYPNPLYVYNIQNAPHAICTRHEHFQSLSEITNAGVDDIIDMVGIPRKIYDQGYPAYLYPLNFGVLLNDITFSHTVSRLNPEDIYTGVEINWDIKCDTEYATFNYTHKEEMAGYPMNIDSYGMPYREGKKASVNLNVYTSAANTAWAGHPTTTFTPYPSPTGTASLIETVAYMTQLFNYYVTADFTLMSDPYNEVYKNNKMCYLSPAYVLVDQDNCPLYPLWVFPTSYSIDVLGGMKVHIAGPAMPINDDIPWQDPRNP